MSEPVNVSVCMATFNGSAYVEHQLRSILAELRHDDEVVIVDDASADDTVALIEGLDDPRVRVIRAPQNRGYVRSFEEAVLDARGEVILLADQDDEWVPGRVEVLSAAARSTGFAASNLEILGSGEPLRSPLSGRPWRVSASTSRHRLRNELRILAGTAPYFGCAMAVRRDVLAAITPLPAFVTESHDLWIATVANAAGRMSHVDAVTVRRRIHDANASSPRPRGLRRALASRWMLVRAWSEARRRRTLLD